MEVLCRVLESFPQLSRSFKDEAAHPIYPENKAFCRTKVLNEIRGPDRVVVVRKCFTSTEGALLWLPHFVAWSVGE